MDEDDIIEEEIDDIDEQASFFPDRTIGSRNIGVPNALQNRGLNRRSNNLSKKSPEKQQPKLNSSNPLGKKNDINKGNSSIINKLKRKNKPISLLNRNKNKKSNNSEENNSEDNNSEDNNINENVNSGNSVDDVIVKAKRTVLIIKISIIAIVIIAIVVFLIAIVSFFGTIFGISDDFSNLGSTSSLDPTSEYYKEKEKYYENLNKAAEMYSESCNIYLNRAYIHAVLSYVWIVTDSELDEKKQYQVMADNVDDVASLMVTNCIVDYEINGAFYNNLKSSSFFKKYYGEALEYIDDESLLKEIFEYAKTGIELSKLGSGYISDNLKVTMGTCERPYNKKLVNEGSGYSSTIGFSDYLKGVIYGEITGSIKTNYIEFLKAHVIAATSVVLSNAKYQSGDEEIWVHNGTCWQVSCDINEGCTLCKDLNPNSITALTGNNRACNNTNRRVPPIPDDKRQILDKVFDEVYGIVMLNNDGSIKEAQYRDKLETCGSVSECMGQIEAARDANMGMSYQEILEKYYSNFTLTSMAEDSYAGDVNYDDGGFTEKVVYYDQTAYNDRFCGLNRTIKTDGCGVTSMAMILSTFIDKSYTPPVVMQEAYSQGAGKYCGGGVIGTNASFFKFSAKKHGLGYSAVSKSGNKQTVIDALKSGKSLVIAHMGQGTFTNGGHYIVLSKINEKGQVYVLDSNHSRRTGWHDFDKVVTKQLKGSFHIITKR